MNKRVFWQRWTCGLLAVGCLFLMAAKLSTYATLGSIDGDEKIVVTDDPSGTPVTKNLVVDDLVNYATDAIPDATASQTGLATSTQITKLDAIEALADVTDATNVDAAGAVMNSDSSTASMSFVIDEDDMASDSATKVPSQQSVKAYVDASGGGIDLGNITETVGITAANTTADISTASYVSKSLDVSSQCFFPSGICLNSSLSKLYVNDESSPSSLYQYTLSTPGDISTGSYDSSFVYSAQDAGMNDMAANADVSLIWMLSSGSFTKKVYQYTLSTPADITTIGYASKSFDYSSQFTFGRAIAFNSNQSKMLLLDNAGTVYQYTLSTPGDISTASYDGKTLVVSGQITNGRGVRCNDDLSSVWVMGRDTDSIFQYNISTPGDISTGSYASLSKSVNAQEAVPMGLYFSSDEQFLYVVGQASAGFVYQYELSSFSSAGQALNIVAGTTTLQAVIIDGTVTIFDGEISIGGNDSGGTGYKLLRIPN